jgi:hypothetical protein
MAVTVFALQTLYAFWRWWRSPTARRLVLCGLSLGLALAAKASAVLLPAMLVGILALLAWRPGATPARSGPALPTAAAALAGIGALALAVLWAAYGGSFRMEPARIGPFDALPVPNYLQIFLFTARIAQESKPFWFFGELVAQPAWYFLPAAFLLKTPLPTLLLAIGAAGQHSAAFREARLAVFLGVPALLYAGVACFAMKVPQGLRFLLPLYPLLFVFMATRLVALARPLARVGALALGAWLAATSLLAHPHYLSYFNALIGGPERAHRIFADSNLDWGQDLPRLAHWLEERGNPKIRVALFGPQSPEAFGIRAWPLPGCRPVDFGLLAISAAVLHGIHGARYPLPQPPPGCYAWLGQRQPIATLGSILVFDLGPRRGPGADTRKRPPARAAVH